MDVFKYNWTEQMKTNPVANKVLNNYDVEDDVVKDPGFIRYSLWKKYKKKTDQKNSRGKFKYETKFKRKNVDKLYSTKRFLKTEKYPSFESVLRKHKQFDQWYLKRRSFKFSEPHYVYIPQSSEDHYWANTRPQSLYNLRYASIR